MLFENQNYDLVMPRASKLRMTRPLLRCVLSHRSCVRRGTLGIIHIESSQRRIMDNAP
jgi:hypothetical protein